MHEVEENQVDFFVDSLEEWRKAVGVERMHLLGHSWGGYLSTHYAAKHPERVASLILLSPWGVPLPDDGVLQMSLQVTRPPYRARCSWGALRSWAVVLLLAGHIFLKDEC